MMFLIAKIFFWIIGIMFFAGVIGSALVVMLTSVEDVKELREKKEAEGPAKMMQDDHFEETFPVSPTSSGRGR